MAVVVKNIFRGVLSVKKFSAVFALFLLSVAALARAEEKPPVKPVVWGLYNQNKGCVIFAEGRKTSGMYWGVAVTMKFQGKLTVLEEQNTSLDQKVYIETQENMNELMNLAQERQLKFVKIPEKHTPELLEEARALCK